MADAAVLLKKAEAANARAGTRGGRLAEQALAAAEQQDALDVGLRAVRLASRVREDRGDIDGCLTLRRRGVHWLLRVRPREESTLRVGVEVFLYQAAASINHLRSSYDEVLEVLLDMEELLAEAELSHRRDGLAYIRSVLCSNRDDLKGSLAAITEAIDVKEHNDSYGWGYSMDVYQRVRVDRLRKLGLREEAEVDIQSMLKSCRDQERRVELLCMLARCAFESDDLPLARERIGHALDVAALGGLAIERNCLGAAVDIYRACGDFDTARRWAERYLELVESAGRRFYLSLALEDVVNTALDQGDIPAARRYLARALPLAEEEDARRGAVVRVPVVLEQQHRLAVLEAG